MSKTPILFHELDLDTVLSNHSKSIDQKLESLQKSEITQSNPEEVIGSFVDEFRVAPIELLDGATSISVDEVQLDVSRDFDRIIFDRSRPFYIPGIQVSYFVPFKGDPTLFRCRPNTFNYNPPHAEVAGNELVFRFRNTGPDASQTKGQFDNQLSQVKQYLSWMTGQINAFNNSLAGRIREKLDSRLKRLEATTNSLASIGLPIRSNATIPVKQSAARITKTRTRKEPVQFYDVALSFAGEDRQYVERVAQKLQGFGINVFYDAFESASLWGKNLIDHLADIYRNRSRYVVIFISRHYVGKAWPKHERQSAQDRALISNEEYVLPARFDDSEVPGLPGSVAYIDLRNTSPEEFADLITKKLKK